MTVKKKKEIRKWRKPREKKYRGMLVDARLDTDILDALNRIRKIRVISVCAGHNYPTASTYEYHGNVPAINFRHSNPEEACRQMRAMRKKTSDFRCYHPTHPSAKGTLVIIRGTKKSTRGEGKEGETPKYGRTCRDGEAAPAWKTYRPRKDREAP